MEYPVIKLNALTFNLIILGDKFYRYNGINQCLINYPRSIFKTRNVGKTLGGDA